MEENIAIVLSVGGEPTFFFAGAFVITACSGKDVIARRNSLNRLSSPGAVATIGTLEELPVHRARSAMTSVML